MTEFIPPTNLQAQATLRRDYPPFVRGVGSALGLNYSQQQELAKVQPATWLPWTMSVLGGEERVPAIRTDERLVTLLPEKVRPLMGGEIIMQGAEYFDFRKGELAQRTQALYAQNTPGSRTRMERLSASCARFMVTLGALTGITTKSWRDYVATVPQTLLKPDDRGIVRVEFPGGTEEKYPIDGEVRSIVTYGPGMTGSMLAGEMAGRADEFHFVSGGISALFMNKWIADQLDVMKAGIVDLRRTGALQKMVTPGIRPEDVRVPEAHFYNDGIADAIGGIANKTVGRGKFVDVVLMSAVHSAGAEECMAGVHGAHDLLREGGLFVVKAPRVSVGNEGGLDVVAPIAYQLFGGPAVAGECGRLGLYTNPNLPAERPADFAIYQK